MRVIYWPDGEPGAGTSWERSGPIHGYAESGFRERNSQLLSLSEAAYAVGLRHIERDLDDPQTPRYAPTICALSPCVATKVAPRKSG